jgi:endonuclease-8
VPEGDSIWRTARALDAALSGQTVRVFDSTLPSVSAAAARQGIVGQTIDSVEAQGKHLLIRFGSGLALHTHLGMWGSWRVYRTGSTRRPARGRPRARIETAGAIAVCYAAPVVELLTARQGASHPALVRLGPDLLGETFDADAARARLRARGELAIGVALMDQTALAGIGNVYKSEVLFLAGVRPTVPVRDLDDIALDRLVATARELMTRNVDPATRGPRRTTSALSPSPVWVYRRSGKPCLRCGDRIRRVVQGEQARSSYYCPACQPRPVPDAATRR